ncbi:MAG TPA: DUF2752 domain-containing protein [Thermoanaerobaculia bacterium]|jgi:hypothetical protein|nr:DUF2752 domain-containing protein [Thermoanaerobaculia bacterium]
MAPFASLLRSRAATALLTGIAALHLALTAVGLPGWPCPLLHGFGIPCPGCGLTRAALELLRGQWRAALAHHAFAPLLLAGVAVIAAASLLPERSRLALIGGVERLERRTGLTAVVLAGLVLYWIARFAFARETLLLLAGGQP